MTITSSVSVLSVVALVAEDGGASGCPISPAVVGEDAGGGGGAANG